MDADFYEKQLRRLKDCETLKREERMKRIGIWLLMTVMFVIGFVIGGL